MQFNINSYNSPFNIASTGLDISSDRLIETLNNYSPRISICSEKRHLHQAQTLQAI